ERISTERNPEPDLPLSSDIGPAGTEGKRRHDFPPHRHRHDPRRARRLHDGGRAAADARSAVGASPMRPFGASRPATARLFGLATVAAALAATAIAVRRAARRAERANPPLG